MHIIFESVLMLFAKNCQNLLTLVKIFFETQCTWRDNGRPNSYTAMLINPL